MKTLNEKLNRMKSELQERNVKIMLIGLGSVGNYLLDYLISMADANMEICVVGRNVSKMQSDVNIVKIASMIRGQNRTRVTIIGNVDLENTDAIAGAIQSFQPDILVNSSRAYSGLKYGSISWKYIRAYGIWAPLAIKFTRNIIEACEKANSDAIIINTSYSDAVIPWLKSAGRTYPDFGSGNINHLIPRIKFAVANEISIDDYWNIDITLATSHFHDVVISKEGHAEGLDMLLDVRYSNAKLDVDINKILSGCCIPMPTDAKRNQMNASSNFEIITDVLDAVKFGRKKKLHSPGIYGEIGGYPVIIDGSSNEMKAYICEDYFTIDEMRQKNRESIFLDGIEDISNGVLVYSDDLLEKVHKAFGTHLVKQVAFDQIEQVSDFLIEEIISRYA